MGGRRTKAIMNVMRVSVKCLRLPDHMVW